MVKQMLWICQSLKKTEVSYASVSKSHPWYTYSCRTQSRLMMGFSQSKAVVPFPQRGTSVSTGLLRSSDAAQTTSVKRGMFCGNTGLLTSTHASGTRETILIDPTQINTAELSALVFTRAKVALVCAGGLGGNCWRMGFQRYSSNSNQLCSRAVWNMHYTAAHPIVEIMESNSIFDII